jgi:hypothetical protein
MPVQLKSLVLKRLNKIASCLEFNYRLQITTEQKLPEEFNL